MDQSSKLNQTPGEAANRSAIDHIHPFEPPPTVPDHEVLTITTEELAGHSPDGRPADTHSAHRGRIALALVLLLGLPAIMVLVAILGGTEALLMGLVYAGVLIVVAFPVWYSGLMRHQEEREATQIVRHTLTAERFGPLTHR